MNQINVRKLAVNALTAITYKKEYMNEVLAKESVKIDRENQGYLYRVVNGVVENLLYIDTLISSQSKIKLAKLRENDKNILRLSIYEMIYMDSIPTYATVNEAIKMMKKSNYQLVKYTNGLLRNFADNYEKIIDDFDKKDQDEISKLSVIYSHPKWMVERMINDFGIEETKELLKSNNAMPYLSIRTNTLKITRDDLLKKLIYLGIDAKPSEYLSEAIIIESLNQVDLFNTKLFKKGNFVAQDLSSILVGYALSPERGEKILDMCSAPGGKSTHIAQLIEDDGIVVARDISYEKIYKIKENTERLGLKSVKLELKDASILDEESVNAFDRVLLDAPCSGLGIIRRKPDIKWHRQMEDIDNLRKIQLIMLNNAAKYVKIGGVLVYSTCTIDKKENDEVIKSFLDTHSEFVVDTMENVPVEFIDGNYLRILPNRHNMDGFFACRLKKI
ncbi:MAG: 16S rRNA (cytosine(967)-C(5))-methyltransferase RsmB [Clostridiales bacterium]|nr:16S rRNA (cytosine(967)-C(5))-methyltransferase RsmB [Clostridiales bacterium]